LDIDVALRKIAVKIECKTVKGTGFLIQPATNEYTYVITARHCLKGKRESEQEYEDSDIIIKRGNINATTPTITVLKSYLHKDENIDVAIICVEYIQDVPEVYIDKPKFNDECWIYGYPDILETDRVTNNHDIVYANICDTGISDNIVEIKVKERQETTGSRTAINIQGFSGSAIFGADSNAIKIYGVFTDLKLANTPHNTYCGFSNIRIKEVTEQYDIAGLVHYKLTTFENYLDQAFTKYPDSVQAIFKKKFIENIYITPKDVVDVMDNKLVVPYGDVCYLSDELWIGWTKFIIILYVSGIDLTDISNIRYISTFLESRIKFFHSASYSRSEDIICGIFKNRDVLDDMCDNDIVMMNTNETPYEKFLNKERIKNIVRKINDSDKYCNGIDITQPDYSRNISGIHIELFGEKFYSEIDSEINFFTVEREIKQIVLGVLEDAAK